jgi:hypothetical protein
VGADRILQQGEDPFHQDWTVLKSVGPNILQSYNIDYVILHKDALFDDEFVFLHEAITSHMGTPFFNDGTVVAYRVEADSMFEWPTVDHLVIVAGKGWYLPLWNGEKIVRRMIGNGEIILLSPDHQTVQLEIEWNSRPDQIVKLVQISTNGIPLETAIVPRDGTKLISHPYQLNKGFNLVSIESMGDTQYSDQVADVMQFDLDVSQLKIIPSEMTQVNLPITAQFGESIELIGVKWKINNEEELPRTVEIALNWYAKKQVEESYKVFIHILDQNENLITQVDSIPVNWYLPTNAWQPEKVIVDWYQIKLPTDYQVSEIGKIRIGMYHPDSLQRLEVKTLVGENVVVADSSLVFPWVTP